MSANHQRTRRRRAILDGSLLLTLILLLGAAMLPAQAKSAGLPPGVFAGGVEPESSPIYQNLASVKPTVPALSPAPASLDNNTMAAVMATLNAALSSSLYFINLPLVTQ